VRAQLSGTIRLTKDAAATIQMLELMGGKKIDILQGVSPEPLDVNAILPGRIDPDIAGALGMVGQLRGDIVQLSANANTLLTNLNAVAGDAAFQASVKETFVNLNGALKEMRGMIDENRGAARRIAGNVDRLTAGLDTLLRESRPRLAATLDRAGGVMERTDSLFADLRSLLGEMRTGNGILQKAIRDSSFTTRIDSVMTKTGQLLDLLLDRGVKVRIRL
jgi:ABC-type transporter Mla subunit MlaD